MDDFEAFVAGAEPRLRKALVAARGPVDGRDAVAEALAYAWEHWPRVREMANPVGYLYRVGQSRSRRRRVRAFSERRDDHGLPEVEPRLKDAFGRLSEQQRVAVLLVHGFDWPHAEVADLLGCSPSTVSTHVQRGMERLRGVLEVAANG